MNNDFATSYAAIIKAEKQDDGSLMVYGKATDETLDLDNQICDAAWLSTAMPQWFKSGGNIREMHSSIAAGVAKEYEAKEDGHYIRAHVVDRDSVKKVEAGVLKGFSIGIKAPRVVRDQKAANGRIIDGQIIEVSLVDRPANPSAKLIMAKSVDGESTLVQVEELHEYSAPLPSEVFKYNENHDERGRFSSGDGGGSGDGKADASSVTSKIESGYANALSSGDVGDRLDAAQVREDAYGHLDDARDHIASGNTRAAARSFSNAANVLDEHPAFAEAASEARSAASAIRGKSASIVKRDVSDKERQALAARGAAMPDGSYPIANVSDLKNAIQAFGRAKNPAAVKKHIIRRARALHALDVLPEEWNVGKALKGITPDSVKFDQDAFEVARRAIAQLIQVEAGEMGDGEDETYSLGQLVEVANHLMAWYEGEQQEGETMPESIELSAAADTVKEPDTTAGCDCAGCKSCKSDGGCDDKMCKSHHMDAEKSETIDKCLECGCHKPTESHGASQVVDVTAPGGIPTMANVSTVDTLNTDGSVKSAEADAPAEEKAEEVAEVATEEVSEAEPEVLAEEKSLLSDDVVNAIIEKAVSMATESVKAEVELAKSAIEAAESKAASLETELAQAKSLAMGGAPKRAAIAAGKTPTNDLLVKAAQYSAKAASATDSVLAKGYREIANDLIAEANKSE